MGFARLTGRETRTVDGHDRPLLAFGYEVGRVTHFVAGGRAPAPAND